MIDVSKTSTAAGATPAPVVYVVDDDPSLRDALSSLFRSVGLDVKLFGSAPELLQSKLPQTPSCLVLDIRLPGVSGLDFQNQLGKSGISMPIVFMTGHADVPMSVRAMKAGAVDFLTKPFRDQDMLDAVYAALEADRKRWETDQAMQEFSSLYQTLTAREKEVMTHVVRGLMNKQIAGELGLSEITVKIHRGNVMRKMAVRSVADLVRAAERLGLASGKS
ncbi:response regulator transcription factor [Starkeya sp. ORNL1]|uniref:response regulator transcription factor n=1 Tax=Starkeya sp. ORNL1 TaxID=2709380 RepID=UPI0014645ADB|nr:response regulator transcription factor [Starkeya sp. ORNL1]QJP14202.1 response regulator transcription factor [Starkeya sp. ORNL1]